MKNLIIALLLAFVFVPVVHGQTVPCSNGALFNSETGLSCPVTTLSTEQSNSLLTVIDELRALIARLQAQIERMEDGDTRATGSSREREEKVVDSGFSKIVKTYEREHENMIKNPDGKMATALQSEIRHHFVEFFNEAIKLKLNSSEKVRLEDMLEDAFTASEKGLEHPRFEEYQSLRNKLR